MLEALDEMGDDANDILCCSVCRTCTREGQYTAYISKIVITLWFLTGHLHTCILCGTRDQRIRIRYMYVNIW